MRHMKAVKHIPQEKALVPARFFEETDRMFDEFLGMERFWDGGWGMGRWSFAVDMEESKDAIVLKAELPGLKREDVKITCEGDVLTISGEKAEEKTTDERKLHRGERVYGSFKRSFTLPPGSKAEEVSATYKDGVLTVKVPKNHGAKGREIHIKAE